jgi:hypothetical protein
MHPAAHVAGTAALVASHHGQVAAETGHEDGKQREADPPARPVPVRVGTVARVVLGVVAFRIGNAVVEQASSAV